MRQLCLNPPPNKRIAGLEALGSVERDIGRVPTHWADCLLLSTNTGLSDKRHRTRNESKSHMLYPHYFTG
jgi:hypothetical protein